MVPHIIAGKVPASSRGFSYLIVLGIVLTLILSLGMTSEHLLLTTQRENEEQLIFVGKQYQQAIASYYHQSPDGLKAFPFTLENLVNDDRSLKTRHHIRKLYQDPILNTHDWGLIKNDLGQIIGIYSQSNQTPIKKNIEFLPLNDETITRYADWKFIYRPNNSTISNNDLDDTFGFNSEISQFNDDFAMDSDF